MPQEQPGLGEQALSKIAELGVASQLDDIDKLKIEIRTDPVKLAQGEVDSVAINAENMVVQKDLHLESININTGTVSINALSAIFGKIELTQTTDAEAKIVITESNINHALQSDYIRSKIQNIKLDVRGELINVDITKADLKLPGEGKIVLDISFYLRETNETKHLWVSVIPCLRDNGRRVSLAEILSAKGVNLSLEFVVALLKKVEDLLDLRHFELMGMQLQLKRMDIQAGQATISASLQMEKIPEFKDVFRK